MPDAKVKLVFFDSEAVLKAVDKALVKRLSKMGAYVRRSAQSSIKYVKGVASPGSPPHGHRSSSFTRKKTNRKTGTVSNQASSPLRELIMFGYDASTKSVVVGPMPFHGKTVAPPLLEFGGTRTVQEKTKARTLHYRKHPFMGPALLANKAKFPQELAGLIGSK